MLCTLCAEEEPEVPQSNGDLLGLEATQRQQTIRPAPEPAEPVNWDAPLAAPQVLPDVKACICTAAGRVPACLAQCWHCWQDCLLTGVRISLVEVAEQRAVSSGAVRRSDHLVIPAAVH